MTLVGNAIAIAAEVHKDQVDKGGEPYIYHCLEVMRRAGERYHVLAGTSPHPQYEEWVLCTAVMHDVLEDFEGTFIERDHLRDRIYKEFPSEVSAALSYLTKARGDDYGEYIEHLSRSWLARIVKLADLSHNLEAWRIPSGEITERDYKRWDKYHRAFVRLMREN